MINPFIVKKWGAFVILGGLPVMTYNLVILFYGMWWALGGFFASLLVGSLIANLLLDNPFRGMLEGKGILVVDLNSTGVMNFFIVKVIQPYIFGNIFGRNIKEIYDREAVIQMGEPIEVKQKVIKDVKGLHIEINQEEYSKARFAFNTYPVMIYNDQLKGLVTKDFLAEKEKDAFAEHSVLYLNRQMEDLTSHLRDFGRYVVEQLRPKESWLANKWVWIIIIVALGIMLALFTPKIIESLSGGIGGAIAGSSPSGQIVTPLN